MKRICQYPIQITDEQVIELPKDAKILTVQFQKDKAYLYCLIDINEELEEIKIRMHCKQELEEIKIGIHFESRSDNLLYIETFRLNKYSKFIIPCISGIETRKKI